ncbi:MAG TPA: alcohol dehydrogenase, partial [Ferroplasma sp.]|nr:alcohol dehydrogenase [Ferroplasma sp.]
MKSAVYLGKENIRVEDLDIPQISDGELLLRVKAVGVCPTDVKA